MQDIYRAAVQVLRDPQRAQDVTQEVFLQAWKSFHRFEPGTNCKAWLFKILFHSVHHHRRKWFRFPTLDQNEEFLLDNLESSPSIPDKLTDAEILSALDGLSSDFRTVVLLVDVEEFAYREVAGILGIPIGTVMSRLSRGRRALRRALSAVAASYGIGKAAASGVETRGIEE